MYEDVYSTPEKFDLKIVGELGEPDLCYEYNMLVVWQHKDGTFYYGIDSGCSCPSPFEYQTLESLTRISPASMESFRSDVMGFPCEQSEKLKILDLVK